jgi:anaerobic selenocysteine-containing dehydrogenase
MPTELLHQRIPEPFIMLHPQTAIPMGIGEGAPVSVITSGVEAVMNAYLDETVPENVILVQRSMGIPIHGPSPVQIKAVERELA